MKIIEHDFGKKARQVVRDFRERLSLEPSHESNIQANPLPYLERAAERIFRLEEALFEAVKAVAPPDGTAPCGETVQVDKAEYQRLLRCRDIVEQALAEYASDEAPSPPGPA